MKTNRAWKVILKRELCSYFSSPVAYFVICLFLLASGLLVFSTFFISGRAELRNFFVLLPIVFSFFIPALTMRVFSEEKRSGSYETLLTLPVSVKDIVMGKYLAVFILSVAMLVPTILYVLTCCAFGNPDAGPIIGGYIGAVLLAAAFCSIGIFASAVTKNQIVAFFLAFSICIVLAFLDNFSILLPAVIVPFVKFISSASHFESIARGVIDTRDVIYFISMALGFSVMTIYVLDNAKKG
ncbi:MAG: ABC transporter permease subunit [Treponema sp.]|nr:ABC transporter permease subunit [Treponema sp.]